MGNLQGASAQEEAEPKRPVFNPFRNGLFCVSWDGTVLAKIPKDLHFLIDLHCKRSIRMQTKFGWNGVDVDQTEFYAPNGVVTDKNGHIFVIEQRQCRIREYTPDFKHVRDFSEDLATPVSACFDAHGNLAVVDGGHHHVQLFTPTGKILLRFGQRGTGDGELFFPRGIAVDNEGNWVVSDAWNHRIQIFGHTGSWIKKFGSFGTSPGQLDGPSGVAIDPRTNNIVVAESRNSRVQIFDPNGKSLRIIGSTGMKEGQFSSPFGLTIDRNGYILVADEKNHRIQMFSSLGQIMMSFGSFGEEDDQMNGPVAAVVDKDGQILVADTGNNRILIWG